MHRDVKPENLMFTNESRTLLKLIDFGFASKFASRPLRPEPCSI